MNLLKEFLDETMPSLDDIMPCLITLILSIVLFGSIYLTAYLTNNIEKVPIDPNAFQTIKEYSYTNHMTLSDYKFDISDSVLFKTAKDIITKKAIEDKKQNDKEKILKQNDLLNINTNIALVDGYNNRTINIELVGNDFTDTEINQLAYHIVDAMKVMLNDRRNEKEYLGKFYKFTDNYKLKLSND